LLWVCAIVDVLLLFVLRYASFAAPVAAVYAVLVLLAAGNVAVFAYGGHLACFLKWV
jgi:hypothetical protein